MTERSGGISLEVMQYKARQEQGPVKRDEFQISSEAVELSNLFIGIRSSDAEVAKQARIKINGKFIRETKNLKVGGKVISSFRALEGMVAEVDPSKLNPTEKKKYDKARGLYMDYVDGAGFGLVVGLEKDADVSALITAKNASGLDTLLGLDPVLAGMGEVMVNSVVTDPVLKKHLKLLEIEVKGQKSSLRSVFQGELKSVSDAYKEGKVNDAEAEMVVAYLSAMVGGLVEEEGRVAAGVAGGPMQPVVEAVNNLAAAGELRVPKDADPDKELKLQLEFMRRLLRGAELISGPINDMDYQREVARIEQLMDDVRPEVKEEIIPRLCIDACWRLMNQANGFISTKEGITMGTAANYAVEQQKDPTREVMSWLFDKNRDVNGLPFREAWDFIQFANFRYLDLLDIMKSKTELIKLRNEFGAGVTEERLLGGLEASFDNDRQLFLARVNFQTDSDSERKKWIRYFIRTKIEEGWVYDGKKNKLVRGKRGRYEADLVLQGLDMAEKAVVAFGETNVANAGMQQGNDEIAELIDADDFRRAKAQRSKAGPDYHKLLIKTIPGATSWVRQLDAHHPDNKSPLWADEVEWRRVAQGDYRFYYGVNLPKAYRAFHDYLLNMELKPQDVLNINFLKDASHLFDRADPPEKVVRIVGDKGDEYLSVKERPVEVRGLRGKVEKKWVKYVKYQGGEYEVTEPRKKVDGIPNARVDGPYVFMGKKGQAKAYRIEIDSDAVIEPDPRTGEEERKIVEYVKYGGRKHVLIEAEPAYVTLPRVGKVEVTQGRNGSQMLRIRFLQGLVETWLLREDLGATIEAIAELGRLATRQSMGAGFGSFESPENWRRGVVENKILDVNKRMARMEVRRRIAERNRRSAGATRF